MLREMPRILAGDVEDWKGTRRKLRKAHWLTMSGLGQKRKWQLPLAMSGLPPIATEERTSREVPPPSSGCHPCKAALELNGNIDFTHHHCDENRTGKVPF
jgi:hypothetical protein